MEKESPLHNAKTKYMTQMSSFFLCYGLIRFCKCHFTLFFFFLAESIVLRIFSMSLFFYLFWHPESNLCIITSVYLLDDSNNYVFPKPCVSCSQSSP